ncbi:hypothetical protein SDC9_74666 [bioreactor metagenome]|uniref:Uncharacterized protein n=1 Tax=bioreactor metagenome TaxID=1076179 RepID=A0A644YIM3_9ZZZZ
MGGKEDRRAAFPLFFDQLEKGPLHEGVQAARRLVEDDEPRSVQKALDDAHLLFVAQAHVLDLPVQVQLQKDRQLPDARGAVLPVEARGVAQKIRGFHVVVIKDLAGQVAHVG